MAEPAISYTVRPDATPELEVSTLARVYRLVLDKKKAVPDRRPKDEKERSKDDSLARTHST